MSAQVDHRYDDAVVDGPEEFTDRADRPYGPPDDADEFEADEFEAAEFEAAEGGPLSRAELRADFGTRFEADYQRLVAQLYAITLDPGEAHDAVQDAYSRAWRDWEVIRRTPDPTAWIRRVAVRSTIRSWRRVVGRRHSVDDAVDARTGALLGALARLPSAERRCVVLFHMSGMALPEIAALERASLGTVQARLARARNVVTEGLAEVLPAVLGMMTGSQEIHAQEIYAQETYAQDPYEGNPYADEGEYR